MLSQEVNDFEKSTIQYFNEIGDIRPLSKEEERVLLKEYKETHSEEAKNKLLKANLKFVVSVAKMYKNKGLAFADLVAEGNLGLIKALDKFDVEKFDVKFFTYAVWWIKQKIEEAIAKRNNIPAEELPSDHENNTTEDAEDTTETLVDENFINTEYSTSFQKEQEIKQVVELLAEGLTERERSILIDYYGIDGGKPKTLEEIGNKFHLTKERVRQINEISLKKMRSMALNKCITKDIYR